MRGIPTLIPTLNTDIGRNYWIWLLGGRRGGGGAPIRRSGAASKAAFGGRRGAAWPLGRDAYAEGSARRDSLAEPVPWGIEGITVLLDRKMGNLFVRRREKNEEEKE